MAALQDHLQALLRAAILIVVLLTASLGQQRGNSRSLLPTRKSIINTQQWYFARGRAKMQSGGVTSANRRLIRADPNAASHPIAFADPPRVDNRHTGHAIGFVGNGNPSFSGGRASHPQGDDPSSLTNPLFPHVGRTSQVVAPSPPTTGISEADLTLEAVPDHEETVNKPEGGDLLADFSSLSSTSTPVSGSESASHPPPIIDGITEQQGDDTPLTGSVVSPVSSVTGNGGNNNLNKPTETSSSNPENKPRSFHTREKPRCANNERATPCENDVDYNEEITNRIRGILRDSRMNAIIENSAVSELLEDSALVKDKTFPGPSVRFGPEGDFVSETPACRAQESIIYPQRAKTTSDDWVFVINQDTVKQGVRVEKCIREGQTCDLGVAQTPTIRTTCRQKFIYRKLLVLNDSGSDVQPESVLIPSCCVCYIRRLDDLVSGRIFNSTQATGATMPDYSN